MPTTPVYGLPWPLSTATPDVPRDTQALAEATEQALDTETTRLDGDIDAVDQALTGTGIRGLLVQARSSTGTVAGDGKLRVTYPKPFQAGQQLVVVGTPGDTYIGSGPFYVLPQASYADFYGFTPGAAVRINWIAVGVPA